MANPSKRLNVLLVAEESAGAGILRFLSTSGHRVVAVLTTPPAEAGGGASCWHLSHRLGYRTLPARSVTAPRLAHALLEERADILLNVYSLFVIADALLQVPALGCFNLHPGPLPRYAGLNAPSWAIYRGEREHGVTVHHMDSKVDAGAIAFQRRFPIGDEETGCSVAIRCIREGIRLMQELLRVAATEPDAIPRIPQDLARREYFGREAPNGGRLDWRRPARDVANFVRAACYHPFVSPWGHPRTTWDGCEIGVVIAAPAADRRADAAPGTVMELVGPAARVACGDGCVLLQKVRVAGAYRDAADVLRPGATLESCHNP